VALLARNGYQAWGLEISQGAVDAANESVKAELDQSSNQHAEIILGDFFKQDYETQFGADFKGFDLIYDYTVSIRCRCRDIAMEADKLSSFALYFPRCGKIGLNACKPFSRQPESSYASSSQCGNL
jgi:hypothetical protein